MGVIRGILLVIVAVLFFFSVLLINLSWTLNLSLNYDNVQKQSTVIIKDILQQNANISSIMTVASPLMQAYCHQNNTNYVFNSGGLTFDIPCNVTSQGSDAIVDAGIKSVIHLVYYTSYNCAVLDCPVKYPIPIYLISEKAYNFWGDKFHLLLFIAGGLLILLFLLVEKKTNLFILAGSLVIIASLPFIKLQSLISLFSNKMIVNLLQIFFSQSFTVAIRTLLVGVALLAAGIILDVFKIGFSIE